METKSKPTFLLVLCILTFIGSGWGFLNNTISFATGAVYTTADTEVLMEAREQVQEDLEDSGDVDDETADKAMGFLDGIFGQAEVISKFKVELAANNLVFAIVNIIGAILMIMLQRRGYFLYVFGCALEIIVPILIIGFVPLLFYPALLINGLFVVLYTTQLKHLD